MATNPIARRIYDFLKEIPPFAYLGTDALRRISGRVEVQYFPSGGIIFEAGQKPGKQFFVIREGAVDLLQVSDEDGEVLVERCGEGELFGIRPLLAEDDYVLRARAAEETLLYAIRSEGIREQLEDLPKVTNYLATAMARGRTQKLPLMQPGRMALAVDAQVASNYLLELQAVHRSKPPVTCTPDIPVAEAAEIMTEHDVGSIIIVNEDRHPIGILTDRDIRRNIATGLYGRKRNIGAVMTHPVVCVPADIVVAEVQIAMVKFDIHHLVVTEDGTNNSPITGVISEHDLLVLQGNNPAVLIREIARAATATYLRDLRIRAEQLLHQYLKQEVSIAYITTIMTEINDEIIRRSITLALREMRAAGKGEPPCKFAWMSLGSQGRGEQLLRTDQDSALVFDIQPPNQVEATKAYFVELGERATELLYQVGYDYCPGNMMASNPQYTLSINGWKKLFSKWMQDPNSENILNVSVFFDYRCVYGEEQLTEALTDHIFGEMEQTALFQTYLARAALQNPAPLTFFRNFMVERSGEHKDMFDLKARAMMPLTDAARVLILQARKGGINNTIKRFMALSEQEPHNAELFKAAAEAYEVLVRLRALIGLNRGDNGRYIKPSELSRLQRVMLRNTFSPVRDIQRLLEIRFQLNFLR